MGLDFSSLPPHFVCVCVCVCVCFTLRAPVSCRKRSLRLMIRGAKCLDSQTLQSNTRTVLILCFSLVFFSPSPIINLSMSLSVCAGQRGKGRRLTRPRCHLLSPSAPQQQEALCGWPASGSTVAGDARVDVDVITTLIVIMIVIVTMPAAAATSLGRDARHHHHPPFTPLQLPMSLLRPLFPVARLLQPPRNLSPALASRIA